jgi:hypothetical protein
MHIWSCFKGNSTGEHEATHFEFAGTVKQLKTYISYRQQLHIFEHSFSAAFGMKTDL